MDSIQFGGQQGYGSIKDIMSVVWDIAKITILGVYGEHIDFDKTPDIELKSNISKHGCR